MSGYTKHSYNKDLINIKKIFSGYLNKLISILPVDYNFETIITLLKKYYSFEWQLLNEKYEYYCVKDKKLVTLRKKIRFSMMQPVLLIQNLDVCQKILSERYIELYKVNFDKYIYIKNKEKLEQERMPKINKRQEKIDKAKLKAQEVEPFYLEALMGLYERKTTTQKDKVYIFKELEKYYCPKIIGFFKKKVDTEYNRQLREMAFYHLQVFGHFSVLRKQKYMKIPSKNKKRRNYLEEEYMNQRFSISEIPEELEYRIQNSKEQKLKVYDFFISHSSADFKVVQSLIHDLNMKNKNIYCDWMNDTDYLKRNLVGNATKMVIEKRLNQSNGVLFVLSSNSLNSKWVKYELNYFYHLKKPIFVITKENISRGLYSFEKLNDLWFYDKNFMNINLFEDILVRERKS